MDIRFLSAEMVIESLRDNGYVNTAYAVAELIDNSLQAKATRVEVGFIEEQKQSINNSNRTPYTVSEISIWDNGGGMDPDTLRTAMQFGGGNHRHDKQGMGKFGMGLPNSSISQCKRVEVWSWQNGSKAFYTYLDVNEMKEGSLETVPEPVEKLISEKYMRAFFSNKMPESGTLIIWSNLDRLSWKTGQSIYRHCENLIGRMYRNFISNDNIKIESRTYRKADNDLLNVSSDSFKANDPMYLKKQTTLPELPGSYKDEAFFELIDREVISVEYTAEDGSIKRDDVTITTSMIKKNIADRILKDVPINSKLGGTRWGKHCKKNIGISIMRANRELVLRDLFLTSALRENKGRFVGIEVAFPPTLDSVFGVTNNKQDAVLLVPYELGNLSTQAGFDSEQEYLRDLDENGDSLRQVLKVTSAIKKQVTALTKSLLTIKVDGKAVKGREAVETEATSELAASNATKGALTREEHGHKTDTVSEELKKTDIVSHLINEGVSSKEEAEEKAERLILTGNRFLIENVARDSEAFFDVSTSKGLTLVLFNTNHVFFQKLVSKLGEEELEVMQTTIAGFARVMNETTDDKRLKYLNSIRREWGMIISEFLDSSDEESDDF